MKARFIFPSNIELDEAVKYYNHQLPGLGFRFLQEVSSAINNITLFPQAWTKIGEHTRRYIFKKFPYALLYHIEKDEILISAVAHLHRNPEHYKHRLK